MDDFANDPTTTGVIDIGGSVTGELEQQGDTDWFAVTLEEGVSYIFDLKGAASDEGTLVDPFLDLVDSEQFFLAGDDDSGTGLESRIAGFVPETSGTFFLIARGFSDFQTGSYTLSAEELIDAVGDDIASAAPILPSTTVTGRFESSDDADVFSINLEAGVPVRVDMATERFNAETQIEILDADGNVLASNGNTGFSRSVLIDEFIPATTGEVFIRAEANFGRATADYTLLVQSLAPVIATGGAGADALLGGAGDDQLSGEAGDDRLEGLDGDDVLDGGGGADVMQGAAGDDTILGGDGRDSIAGADGRDSIEGGADKDIIGAGRGNDIVHGGAGDDGIRGGQGNDILLGGDGDDRLSGGNGRDLLIGGAGDDVIGGRQNEDIIYAGRGNDIVGGGRDNDILFLGAGDDTAYGGRDDDSIEGGVGNDSIQGGTGDDTLHGGAGDDTLNGGFGQDVFVFETLIEGDTDTITDFETAAADNLDVSRLSSDRLLIDIGADPDDLDPLGAFDSLDITDGEGGARIAQDGHVIILEGVAASDFMVSDFIFI